MQPDNEKSLSDEATFAGRLKPPTASRDVSLGDERTLGDAVSGQDTILEDIEVVDLEARYRMDGTLGQGGMGAVLLATDTRLDRKVAIKRILGEAGGNRMAVNRFLTEAKSIAALNHPNIVQIYDYGRAKDGPFLIMEFVDGGSLLDRCRDGAMPLEAAVDLACQLCDGLAKAHDLGIIHRDIKPANVLLTKDGIPKLTDFGLAKAQASDHGQTMTGAVLGTPDFMPPEQRRDAALVDHRSDLWSLAATVYQMLTGRSPKIIRFDLLPAELTKVLGKALEDEKEARYQSARELRDAIRTSLRVAATAPTASSSGEGQCPSCGVQNDVNRKFCRRCGESLESPCLSCDKPMPMWDEICGSCGAKQAALLEARRAQMAAEQAKAEGLLGDLAFDKAAAVATRLRDEPSSRLSHLKAWAKDFLGTIEKSRSHQIEQAVEWLAEAAKHEQAFDYLSAIYALESVPNAIRSAILPRAREPVATVLAGLKRKQAESLRLESLVRERITSKSLDGLLPEVDKLLTLHPDRRDVNKLRHQLVERQQKQETARDEAIVAAQSLMASHDYDGAVAALANVPTAAATPEGGRLRTEAEALADRTSKLGNEIRSAVAAKRLDGLIKAVDAYLKLKPAEAQMVRLRESLVAREDKIVAEIAARVEQARKLEQACQFTEAAKAIESIPEERRDDASNELLFRCQLAAAQRSQALQALASVTADSYAKATSVATGYRQTLAAANIEDPEFTAALSRIKTFAAGQERRRTLLRTGGIVAASAVAVIILASCALWIRSSLRAASVASALRSSRWDDALAIDPGNFAAYAGRANEKLSRNPPDIDGAFADIQSAEKLSSGAASVKAARAGVHAARAAARARSGTLSEAAQDLAEAVSLGADPQAISGVREMVVTAWLAHADKAVADRDLMELRLACDGAAKAGAAQVTLQDRWRVYAKGCVEQMDVPSLTTACQELKKHGANPSDIAAMWLQFGDAAANQGDSDGVRVACEAAQIAGASADLIAAVWLGLADKAVAHHNMAGLRLACDGAAKVGAAQVTLQDRWRVYAKGCVEQMDVPSLTTACQELKKHGANPSDIAVMWLQFGDAAANKGDSDGVRVACEAAQIANASADLIAAVWLGLADKAVAHHDMAGLRLACDGAAKVGAAQVTLQDRWRVYAKGSAEQMDVSSLTTACQELKKHGGNPGSIGAMWLQFGDAAARQRDIDAIRVACEAAQTAGAAADVITTLSVKRLVMEAVRESGEKEKAGRLAMEAMQKDSTVAIEMLSSPEAQAARSSAVLEFRKRFDDFFEKRQWNELEATARIAASLDPQATAWLKTVRLSVDDVHNIPPELLAVQPPDFLNSLPPKVLGELPPIRNSVEIQLKLLPAGQFMMGEALGEPRETQHMVTLTRPFYIGVHEVTNAQWKRVMGSVPSNWEEDDRPVEQVSWSDALEFCRKLSALPEERAAGRVYRLPTEAEWEYACRAGTTTTFSFGDDEELRGDFGWFMGNLGDQTHAVGQKEPNSFGLYDMHGNVWEWCNDSYGDFQNVGVTDPQGPSGGSHRIQRGGNSISPAEHCRSAHRASHAPSLQSSFAGFRLALGLPRAESPGAGK